MIELLLPELGVKITITIEKYPPPRRQFHGGYAPLFKITRRADLSNEKTACDFPHIIPAVRRCRSWCMRLKLEMGSFALDDGGEWSVSKRFHILAVQMVSAPPCFRWIETGSEIDTRRKTPAFCAECGRPFHAAHKTRSIAMLRRRAYP